MKVSLFPSGAELPPLSIRRKIIRAVNLAVRRERRKITGELNLVLTDRREIIRLNRKFLDHKGDTDVIAFPYEAMPGAPFGDVYIAVPVARENAARFKDDPDRELIRLAVHGTLHLLGYDDHNPADYRKMWARQESVVDAVTGRKK